MSNRSKNDIAFLYLELNHTHLTNVNQTHSNLKMEYYSEIYILLENVIEMHEGNKSILRMMWKLKMNQLQDNLNIANYFYFYNLSVKQMPSLY